jgi:predicted transcriptional regulator
MATIPSPQKFVPNRMPAESQDQREARIRREAALIAQGEAELQAGLGVEFDAVEAWLDQLESDPDAPIPTAGMPSLKS